MLNAENTRHVAPDAPDTGEEQRPKRKIPIGGIKMPGFCRTKSREPCKVMSKDAIVCCRVISARVRAWLHLTPEQNLCFHHPVDIPRRCSRLVYPGYNLYSTLYIIIEFLSSTRHLPSSFPWRGPGGRTVRSRSEMYRFFTRCGCRCGARCSESSIFFSAAARHGIGDIARGLLFLRV